jgi:hypothetical protein
MAGDEGLRVAKTPASERRARARLGIRSLVGVHCSAHPACESGLASNISEMWARASQAPRLNFASSRLAA